MVLDVMMEQPTTGIAMHRAPAAHCPSLMLTSVQVTGMSFGSDADLVPVDAFFEKPVPPADLLRKVREPLSKSGGRPCSSVASRRFRDDIRALVERHGHAGFSPFSRPPGEARVPDRLRHTGGRPNLGSPRR